MFDDEVIVAVAHKAGLSIEKACRDGMTRLVREHLAEHPDETVRQALYAVHTAWAAGQSDDTTEILSVMSPDEIQEFREKEAEDLVSPLATELSAFVNRMGGDREEGALVRMMLKDHPTLVQSKAGMFLRFFYELADRTYYDARDEASVLTARKIVNALGEYGSSLPYI
mgnify:CR=1 FL=1